MFRDKFKLPKLTFIVGVVSLVLSMLTMFIVLASCLNDEPVAYLKLLCFISIPSGLLGAWCMHRCAQALLAFNHRPYVQRWNNVITKR